MRSLKRQRRIQVIAIAAIALIGATGLIVWASQDAFNFLVEDWMMEARFDSFQDLVHFLSLPLTLIKRPTSIRRGCRRT